MPPTRTHAYEDTGRSVTHPYATYPCSEYLSSSFPLREVSTVASKSKLLQALDKLDYTHPLGSGSSYTARYEHEVPALVSKATPEKKRAKKHVDDNSPAPEKRAARFKKACPKNIMERVERVLYQRFFMIDRRREGEELREEFSVLGSTGNVYTVAIDQIPSCTCPDSQKGNHCKHILFIFLKVLQVPQHSTHWYQKALLTSELEELFRDAPAAPNASANSRIRDAYAEATGKASSSKDKDEGATESKRMPKEEDDCPICYEAMHGAGVSLLVWCETCGNALHKECFNQWKRSCTSLTCVYCRAPWPDASRGKSKAKFSEGYLNLSSVAGVSPQRDTSTYYQGPRRGQRYYGYQDYDFDD